jgi:hypothetical protein
VLLAANSICVSSCELSRYLCVAKSVECKNCQAGRKLTSGEEFLGDWQCPSCKSVNYGKHSSGRNLVDH